MDLHTRHVGNDAVLKGTFKPYLTTNAAVPPLFQKILKEGGGGGGENECKSVCRSHLDAERGSQLLLAAACAEPESVSAHSVGSSAWWALHRGKCALHH